MQNSFIFLMLITLSFFSQAQLPDCSKAEFYAVGYAGSSWGTVIMKFELLSPEGPASYNGSTAEIVDMGAGPFIPNSPEFPKPMGLAVCDFGEGPQLYASSMSFGNDIFEVAKYNGEDWEVVIPDIFSHQIGGMEQHLYLQTHPIMGHVENDRISHYDGEEVVIIWQSQGEDDRIVAADVAVDKNGNAYIFTGNVTEGPGMADTLHIISPDGSTVSEYPIDFSVAGSSGAFFMYDTLYLYFGPYWYLLPIYITDDGVQQGNQIPVPKVFIESSSGPNGNLDLFFISMDADSCFSEQLSTDEIFTVHQSTVYPNPVKDKLHFESKERIDMVEVYNMAGSKMFTKEWKAKSGEIDVKMLPAGTYLLRLVSEGKLTETHKFIKK